MYTQQPPKDTAVTEIIQEIDALVQKVNSYPNLPPKLQEKINLMIERIRRMARMGSYSTEFEVVSKYIDWVTQIPWGNNSLDVIDLKQARQTMDTHHYGMNPIKEMILDYLAVMKLQKQREGSTTGDNKVYKTKAPILCFAGLQGVGKTTMAKSIAEALHRKFIRIPMGALGSVRELRGIPRTTLEATPGLITKALIEAGTMNPIILLDEIDKTSGQEGLRSDMMAFLLEILDPKQNKHFSDYYVDQPMNLSQVFFITTANTTGTISTALLDRLEVIRFTSYSDEEKITIGKRYLLPRVLEDLGLTTTQVTFTEDVWPQIVRPLGFDAGIRQLERNVTKICRKATRKIVEENIQTVEINVLNIREFLPVDVAILN